MLDFQGKVAVVTGAGEGLGKSIAELLGRCGASVLVNDERAGEKNLSRIVEVIEKSGGKAVASTESIRHGSNIIEHALTLFGALHILINASPCSFQAKPFERLEASEWNDVTQQFIKGNFETTRAAWKHFRSNCYGRIINVSSVIGIHGSPEKVIQAAATHSQISFSSTLAKEGFKKNILVNTVVTLDAPDLEYSELAGLVRYLVSHHNTDINGGVYQAARRRISRLRWQRSSGLLLRADENLTPATILQNWQQVGSFSNPEYSSGPRDFLDVLKEGNKLPPNAEVKPISFKGKVVLVTGAGAGLGRAYALHFASLGASVMINDVADPSAVVQEIRKIGGTVASIVGSAEDGHSNIEATIRAFGKIDVLVNNAGILRDKAFHNMSDTMWDQVLSVHLGSTYANCRAAWPHFIRQGYGRIVNTTSVTGIYGQFGQANYAAAKSAIIGLTRALALEGSRHNILVNAIAPNAGTNMTKTILSDEVANKFKPDHVAPLVSALTSHVTPPSANGDVYEVGSGWFGKIRWEVLMGNALEAQNAEQSQLSIVADGIRALETGSKSYPGSVQEHQALFQKPAASKDERAAEVLRNISSAKAALPIGSQHSYTQRDLVLYALSVGVSHTDLPLVFEGHQNFGSLPVYGLIPFFNAKAPYNMEDIMTKYDLRMLLHVDQYLQIRAPIPLSGTLTTYPKLVQVVDKGKDVLVVQGFTTKDANGTDIFYNETTVLVRGGGGFSGDSQLHDRGAATAKNAPPSRAPDHIIEEKTSEGQAALYRLNGDLNPLHIDPAFSEKGGFKTPILHGLCSLGIAGKHVYQTYGPFKDLKGKFTSPVIPGQTLRTEMWLEGKKVVFQSTVVDTGKKAISAAGVTLDQAGQPRL